ncbi:MAG: pitrilysin family protein [Alphaproteobacteria bacterium]|nr:pitrilysin family protein [Alphaproteobacteria bacterium]
MNGFIDHITVLDNGVSVVTRKMPYRRRTAFQIVVEAGSSFEKDGEHGYAHFVEHVLPEETQAYRSYHELNDAFQALGFGKFNLTTSVYYVRCPSSGIDGTPHYFSPSVFPPALDIALNVVGHPRFPHHGVEGERKRILEEMESAKKDIERRNGGLWRAALFPGSCHAKSALGNEKSVLAAQAEGLINFWERNYVGSKTYVFAAGELEHDQIVNKAWAALKHLPCGEPHVFSPLTPAVCEVRIPYGVTGENAFVNLAVKKLAPLARRAIPSLANSFPSLSEQAYLELMWPGAELLSPQRMKQSLTMAVLNGLLNFELVSKKQTLYSINAAANSSLDFGGLYVYGKFHWKKQDTVLDTIQKCLQELSRNPPQTIIDTLKNEKRSFWETYETTVVEQTGRIRDEYLSYGSLESDEEVLAACLRPTTGDVSSVARDILLEKPVSLLAIGPVDKILSRQQIDGRIRGKIAAPVKTPS